MSYKHQNYFSSALINHCEKATIMNEYQHLESKFGGWLLLETLY